MFFSYRSRHKENDGNIQETYSGLGRELKQKGNLTLTLNRKSRLTK